MSSVRVLLLYPRFAQDSFWRNLELARLKGARCMAPPLGLITVAALLPAHWEARLCDLNARALDPADLEWADVVFVSGMLPQRQEALAAVAAMQAAGKVTLVLPW